MPCRSASDLTSSATRCFGPPCPGWRAGITSLSQTDPLVDIPVGEKGAVDVLLDAGEGACVFSNSTGSASSRRTRVRA